MVQMPLKAALLGESIENRFVGKPLGVFFIFLRIWSPVQAMQLSNELKHSSS